MNELIAYLLKVSAGTLLLYLCFHLFFRQDTFYRRNRIILILTILLPLLMPLFQLSGVAEPVAAVSIIHSVITVGATISGKVNTFDYNGLIIMIWLGIAVLLMLRTIFGLMKTAAIIRKGALKADSFPKLIISDLDHPPFSFWPYAVIPRKIFENGDAEDIITHENAHIQQGHTFDLIICELYTSLFWFNPVAWLVKSSIRLNHEFLADQELTSHTVDIKHYQYQLLNIPEAFNRIQLAHSFNNLVKNRIVMINKRQTNAFAALKNLLIIPAVALIFASFSCDNNAIKTKDSANDQTATKKQPQIIIDNRDPRNQNSEEVFVKVDQMPVFPGGERAMMKFIKDNLNYPETAKSTGVQGTVIVNFIVDSKGKVKDAKVMKGNPLFDDEALKLVNSMPVWTPGKQGGRDVAVAYTIPFKFVLN